jgi:hypothetical protein
MLGSSIVYNDEYKLVGILIKDLKWYIVFKGPKMHLIYKSPAIGP